jgi:hypothetical protein
MQKQYAILKRTITGLLATLIITGATMRVDVAAAPVAKNCNPVSFLASVWQDLLGRDITPSEKASMLDFRVFGNCRETPQHLAVSKKKKKPRI